MTTLVIVVVVGVAILVAWIFWDTRPGTGRRMYDSVLQEDAEKYERELKRLCSSLDVNNPDPQVLTQIKQVEKMMELNKILLDASNTKKQS